jgi:hypothetical protein
MLGRRASPKGVARSPAQLYNSGGHYKLYRQPGDIRPHHFFALKVKLPGLMSHPEDCGGIIQRQSAIKQLQKRKEPHREKAKHLSESKSRTS